jgi:hypothetical protein
VRKERVKLVLREDIMLNQIFHMQDKAVVGQFHGRAISKKPLHDWIDRVWKKLLGSFVSHPGKRVVGIHRRPPHPVDTSNHVKGGKEVNTIRLARLIMFLITKFNLMVRNSRCWHILRLTSKSMNKIARTNSLAFIKSYVYHVYFFTFTKT